MSRKKRDIPRFTTPIIETHCHLDYLDDAALPDLLQRCAEVNIERLVTIAVSADNLATVRGLAAGNNNIWCTQGIHPHEAASCNADVLAEIRQHASDNKVVAIGEIGLDYYYNHADPALQRRVFESQLELASELNLPVVIHSREADADTEAILRNAAGRLRRRGVIHSFTSGLALAEFCLAQDFMLGFNGIITFRNAENVREVVDITPLPQLLLETDSPYLTPVPYRGRPNAPYYIPFVAEAVAERKAVAVEALLQQCLDNSLRLFFPHETGSHKPR